MPRLTKIEKLARDICWAEWAGHKFQCRVFTKSGYWREIRQTARNRYVRDAERFVRVAAKVPALLVLCLVRQARQPERSRQ